MLRPSLRELSDVHATCARKLPFFRVLTYFIALAFTGAIAGLASAQGTMDVVEVFPTNQYVTADPSTEMFIEFHEPVDQSTFTPMSVRVFGRWSGPATLRYVFENDDRRVRLVADDAFFAGEYVTVNLSKNILAASGESLSTGYTWSFWIRTAPGSLDQEEVMRIPVRTDGEELIITYGAYAGDLNDDGWSDLTVINERSHDIRVFMNDGFGRFNHHATHEIGAEIWPSPSEGADFNGDGFIDLAVAGMNTDQIAVFIAEEQGVWTSADLYTSDPWNGCLTVLDMDADGDDDIVTSAWDAGHLTTHVNDGSGGFVAGAAINTSLGREFSCVAADANNDGISDLFVGSGRPDYSIVLLLGDATGTFTEHGRVSLGTSSHMLAVGDMDGDGNADVVGVGVKDAVTIAFGDGAGGFSGSKSYPVGDTPLAVDVGDLDGDGDLDVVVSNHFSADFTVYENAGDGTLTNPRLLLAETASSCAILHDRDNDGDLDITGTDERADLIILFENPGVATATEHETIASTLNLSSYPNPSMDGATLGYHLPRGAHVILEIYDVRGRRLATLINEWQSEGHHEAQFQGPAAGVYFARLRAGELTESKPLSTLLHR